MPLFDDSGQTPERRNEEATQIVIVLFESGVRCEEETKECDFLRSMYKMYGRNGKVYATAKQLFWLRDLKEKYL